MFASNIVQNVFFYQTGGGINIPLGLPLVGQIDMICLYSSFTSNHMLSHSTRLNVLTLQYFAISTLFIRELFLN
jgi:hypothetical protein